MRAEIICRVNLSRQKFLMNYIGIGSRYRHRIRSAPSLIIILFQHIGTVHIDLFSEQPFHAVTSGHFIIALLVSIKEALMNLNEQKFVQS